MLLIETTHQGQELNEPEKEAGGFADFNLKDDTMDLIKRIRVDYPDHDVCTRVKNFLSTRHYPTFRDLKVEVDNGVVTLTGSVNSFYEKQVALNACQHVAGVLSLVDQVTVSKQDRDTAVKEIVISRDRQSEKA